MNDMDKLVDLIAEQCGRVAWTSVMVDAGRRDRADLEAAIGQLAPLIRLRALAATPATDTGKAKEDQQ